MSDAGLLVWAQVWQVSIAILLVGLASWRWGRRHPHLMHLLWMLVVVKTLIPPLWSSPTGLFSWTHTLAATCIPDSLQPQANNLSFSPSFEAEQPYIEGRESVVTPTSKFDTTQPAMASTHSSWLPKWVDWKGVWRAQHLELLLLVAWFSGCLILIAGATAHWFRLSRILARNTDETPEWMVSLVDRVRFKLGLRRPFRVVVNSAGIGPLVHGYFRPTLVIPIELAQVDRRRRLEPVIAHEMIHARRGDTLFALIQFASQVVWWFHPMVWWANRQANRCCEQCCDEETVLGLACRPHEYAHCLLDVLELKRKLRAVPGLAGVRSSQVTAKRLKALVQRERPFRERFPIWQWAFPAIGVLLLIPGARVTDEWNLFQPMQQEMANREVMDPAIYALRQEAERELERRNWERAASLYRSVLNEYPEDPLAWFRLGYCLHSAGKLDEAIVAHQRASEFKRVRNVAMYNWACALSLKGQHDDAMRKLNEAVQLGFRSKFPIQNDPDLTPLLDRPDFQSIADKTLINEPWSGENQFSFLLGSWNVYDEENELIGISNVRQEMNGCSIHEEFSGEGWPSSQSCSHFDPMTKTWHQTWTAASGEVIHYEGEFTDGKILMEGRISNSAGPWGLSRMTLKPMPNRAVYQKIEKSTDGGASWLTVCEGTYVPRGGITALDRKTEERSM